MFTQEEGLSLYKLSVNGEMVYGELKGRALKWAMKEVFGLDPESMPASVVVSPFKVEQCFKDFQKILTQNALTFRRVGTGFLVRRNDRRALFCEGGIGASNFADSSYILCHCRNVEEILFVGTGGGIGEDVQTADINLPPSCIRLDKVLEILLPPEAPAEADPTLNRELKIMIEREASSLGITVHNGIHATVPFFLSETRKLLTDLQRQGVVSVDMELSVLYALANYYDKKAAGIVRIGDLPLRGMPTWKSRSCRLRLKEKVHRKILESIIQYLFR
jgi:purine-nucleoside phosphorylase